MYLQKSIWQLNLICNSKRLIKKPTKEATTSTVRADHAETAKLTNY